MPGAWGNPWVIGAVGLMVLALLLHLQWRSRVLCRGVWPWLRWLIVFIDFWLWLPIGFGLLIGLLYLVFWALPGRTGAWFTSAALQGIEAYPAVLIGPALSLLVYKSWLLYFLGRWDPERGLFRLPGWPRQPYRRGPGRRVPREFREPLPWDRGPGTW